MLRKLFTRTRTHPDPRRAKLVAMIKAASNIPRPTKALAMLGVSSMSENELDVVLTVAEDIEPLMKVGDIDGIREKLGALNLPPDVIKMAEGLLAHDKRSTNNNPG